MDATIASHKVTNAKPRKTKVALGSEVITSDEAFERLLVQQRNKEEMGKLKEAKKAEKLQKKNSRKDTGNKERNICKKKKTKANEKIKMTERSSSDSEDDNFSLRDSDEEDYDTFAERITQEVLEEEEFERELLEETDRQKADTKKTEMNPSPLKPKEEMVVGDWAIVKFDGKTTTRYFIGQIIEFDQGEPIFKYVMSSSSKNGQTTCKQPTREDVSSVPMKDIVTYLPPPTTGRRGDIIFKMDLSNWTLE